MKAYEDRLYEQWREQVEAILPSLLKRNVLVKPQIKEPSVAGEELGAEKSEAEAGNVQFFSFSVIQTYYTDTLIFEFSPDKEI